MRDAPTPTHTSRVPADEARSVPPNFVTEVVDADVRSGRTARVVTRFPPEPNGYLHIGHAKAIALDFGIAADYGGRVHLRMDDTNPTTEDPAYVESIERDIRWLGFAWDELRYASDYFEELYGLAERLIDRGDAYVDLRDEATVRATRGTVTDPGSPSADRERAPAENRALFRQMRDGAFPDGGAVLRAKIDLASPNMILRDPVLYRVKHAHHYRTGDAWCIYPLYDFAHPLSDAIEGITHSFCTLEFDNNRAIYDWLVERLFPEPRPRQYEFARLSLDYTVTSKRRLLALVREGIVAGWDDPRMPTLAALRRRGVPPGAIRDLVTRVGVTKANSHTDPALLDTCVRDALNHVAPRVMAVVDPVPLVLTDPDGELAGIDGVDAPSFPDDVDAEGSRLVPLGTRLWIERDDVALDPPAGFKRLAPGRAVRLRHAVVVRCDRVEVDGDGRMAAVHATVVPGSLGRNPDGVKVWAAIHWVDAGSALPAEFRLYDRLFRSAEPGADGADFRADLDPASFALRRGWIEPSVAGDAVDVRYQFERLGYFWRDPEDGRDASLVWNRIVTLKDGRRPDADAATADPKAERKPAHEAGRDAGAPRRSRGRRRARRARSGGAAPRRRLGRGRRARGRRRAHRGRTRARRPLRRGGRGRCRTRRRGALGGAGRARRAARARFARRDPERRRARGAADRPRRRHPPRRRHARGGSKGRRRRGDARRGDRAPWARRRARRRRDRARGRGRARRAPGRARRLPRRQARAARLLRGPGDAGDRRTRRPEAGSGGPRR